MAAILKNGEKQILIINFYYAFLKILVYYFQPDQKNNTIFT